MVATTDSSIISLMSRLSNSGVSSKNVLPISRTTSTKERTCYVCMVTLLLLLILFTWDQRVFLIITNFSFSLAFFIIINCVSAKV